MKRLFTAVLACFAASVCFAQQQEAQPIMIDGRYAPRTGVAVQPHETVRAKRELEETLLAISHTFAQEKPDYNFIITRARALLGRGFDDPRLYTVAALAYEGLNNCTDALWYADQAISKRPSNAEAYATRAYCFYRKNDMLRARENIETALKLNPSYKHAQDIQAMIMTDTSIVRKPKANVTSGGLPPWFYIYVACVIVVMFVFLIIRYRGLMKGAIDDDGRQLKEVNIKEQYNFIRQIGEGGMGKVYEAYDNVLKRKVAVKRIKPELLKSHYVREQFLSEARMVAMLRHPCIVEIYTVIETANSLYLVFEYVEGQTLETRLDIDGYLTFDEAKEVFGTVCKGLAYAHSHNIVHCDLKPGNIMLSDSGVAKVMDFGVARKVAEGEKGGTRTVAGTPAYMSPEQQKGFMTKQSDIYSLAVCLYEALVGQVPWSVQGFDIITKKMVPPSSINGDIPQVVDQLIERSLSDNPAKRIQTVQEFWDILSKAS